MFALVLAGLTLLAVVSYVFLADVPARRVEKPRKVIVPEGYRGFTLADVDENPEAMPPEPGRRLG